jgi:hypothetical protein
MNLGHRLAMSLGAIRSELRPSLAMSLSAVRSELRPSLR